jgi:hypothetical protein
LRRHFETVFHDDMHKINEDKMMNRQLRRRLNNEFFCIMLIQVLVFENQNPTNVI